MSNKCPHCGAAAGKSHAPCPYGPGGKFYKAPAQKKPLPKTVEIVESPIGTIIHETAPIPEEAVDGIARELRQPTPEGRKAKAATLQAMADGVAAKSPRPQSRASKKAVTIWLDPDGGKALKMAAAKHGVPQEQIIAEGVAYMLGDKYNLHLSDVIEKRLVQPMTSMMTAMADALEAALADLCILDSRMQHEVEMSGGSYEGLRSVRLVEAALEKLGGGSHEPVCSSDLDVHRQELYAALQGLVAAMHGGIEASGEEEEDAAADRSLEALEIAEAALAKARGEL